MKILGEIGRFMFKAQYPKKAYKGFIIFTVFLILVAVRSNFCVELKVFPKLFTPGSPPGNEIVFFDFSEWVDPLPKLKIMDIEGRKVREYATYNPQATVDGWRISWDGKDEDGKFVLPGVYLWQWEEQGKKSKTGVLVVAR